MSKVLQELTERLLPNRPCGKCGRVPLDKPDCPNCFGDGVEPVNIREHQLCELRASLQHFADRATCVGPEEVRYARKAMGMTREKLGAELGVSEEYIRGLEADENVVRTLFRVAMIALLREKLDR